MTERTPIDLSLLVVNPDPFSPDFKVKLEKMVLDETKEFAKETAIKAGKAAFLTIPIALSACSNNASDQIPPHLISTYTGVAFGVFCAAEEAFEKEGKNIFKKSASMAIKGIAGFTGGYAIAHNLQNDGSWMSAENLPYTAALIPAAYAVARETKLSQLWGGIQGKISEVKGSREETDMQRQIKQLSDQAYSSNLKVEKEARDKLRSMGVSPRLIHDIHFGKVDPYSIKIRG